MAKLASAALMVTKDCVRDHDPTPTDIAIAQAFLEGAISVPEISEATGKGDCHIRTRLKNPIAFAWIADKVSGLIHTRIGIVDAALLRKACQGDVRAMELYYKRYGKLAELKIVAHGKLGDLTSYSDEDLDRLLETEKKQNPHLLAPSAPPSATEAVIDVTPEEAS